ncbi:phosphatidylinositol mannoside acyltransferase [Lapillicoccus sp.]|uniref:phosphatidylinositol mannoside acyltransferase n=1 Tax=Lapillicoccus sp. TaxID=1909287 RepID=UPI00326379DD
MNPADTAQAWGLRLGFAAVRALPARAAYRLFDRIADLSFRRGGGGVDRLRSNYAKVRPELTPAELEAMVREGLRSYMRYYCEAFRLVDRSQQELGEAVRVTGDGPMREALAAGTGVVIFVGHQANWDLAGAWSSTHLAPVTTVAERLEPEQVFRDFLEFRESLGMTILPLTGAGDPFVGLKKAIAQGDLVALVADRDLTHNGVEVDLCGHRARVAKGPAVLSVLTGAPLFTAALSYEDAPEMHSGKRVYISFSPPVPVPGEGTTRDKVQVMTQVCADYLGAGIVAHTEDWHMLQRVFVEDLDDRSTTASIPTGTAGAPS